MIIKKSQNFLPGGNSEAYLQLLKQAYSIYNKDPILSINLGLALQRDGDFQSSKNLLLSSMSVLPPGLLDVCLANIAFGEIQASNFAEGVGRLETLMKYLLDESDGNEPNPWDLPSITVAIINDESVIREAPASALKIISYGTSRYSEVVGRVPAVVNSLEALYTKAVALYDESRKSKKL
jgi:hypothetical protein